MAGSSLGSVPRKQSTVGFKVDDALGADVPLPPPAAASNGSSQPATSEHSQPASSGKDSVAAKDSPGTPSKVPGTSKQQKAGSKEERELQKKKAAVALAASVYGLDGMKANMQVT